METVTFYSYKGGVGRSLALKNYAIFLAEYGFNVCIMDFDLEAPGLHYKFSKYLEKNEVKKKKGLVDIIFDYQENKTIPETFEKYSLNPKINPESVEEGLITLLGAGDSMSNEYWKKVSNINWDRLFYESDSTGDLFFLELKERIKNTIKPDFLLIDSRTGITEIGGLCTSLLPDKVVFFICNNDENKEGARLILRNLKMVQRPWEGSIDIIFVLSRFPTPRDPKSEIELNDREVVFAEILGFLNEPFQGNPDPKLIDCINVINSDRGLELSESTETSIELLYTNLFLKIIPKHTKEKIEKGAKNWYK